MDVLTSLIEDAQAIIVASRKESILTFFTQFEEYLSKNGIAVNPYYEEKDFYTYECFPMINFLDHVREYNEELANFNITTNMDISRSNGKAKPLVYNYKHTAYFGKYLVAVFNNIFYPHNNIKFSFSTYEAKARYSDVTIKYIHPKYILEEVIHRMYLPEHHDNREKIIEKYNELVELWDKLGNNAVNKIVSSSIYQNSNYNNSSKWIIKEIASINDTVFIKCFYDTSIPIYATTLIGIEFIEAMIKKSGREYSKIENSSKSFYDNRCNNYIFKLKYGEAFVPIVKLFVILDFELIPVIKGTLDAHILVCMKLAYTEYITYDILNIENISANKLKLFQILKQSYEKKVKKKELISLDNCDYYGKYYPIDLYLKELQTTNILRGNRT